MNVHWFGNFLPAPDTTSTERKRRVKSLWATARLALSSSTLLAQDTDEVAIRVNSIPRAHVRTAMYYYQFRLRHLVLATSVFACISAVAAVLLNGEGRTGTVQELPLFEQELLSTMHVRGLTICEQFT